METKTVEHLEPSVNLPSLLEQAAKEINYFPISMGFQLALNRLTKIAHRAIEINDEEIIKQLKLLGFINE